MATDATPFQTPPSLKNAAGLSDVNEYAATWTGQSNSRPRGYPADAESVAQELKLADTGRDVQNIHIAHNPARAVGEVEILQLAPRAASDNNLLFSEWHTNAYLRLGIMSFAIAGDPQRGYAKVESNQILSLTVKWISLPDVPFVTRESVAVDFTTDVITEATHGLIVGDFVAFDAATMPTTTPAGQFTRHTTYVVLTVPDPNTYTIALGATAIDFTANGTTVVRVDYRTHPVAVVFGTDRITDTGHGLIVGDRVMFGATTMPTIVAGTGTAELHRHTLYAVLAVVDVDTYTIQVAGGAAIDFTANGTDVSRIDPIHSYLVRDPYEVDAEGGPGGSRYYGYEQMRVLTPYMPVIDIQPPLPSAPNTWFAPQSAGYPVADGPLRTGKRLILALPLVKPALVTKFDDLAAFLPMTRREGSHGYGISDVADSSWGGAAATPPISHPITALSTETFTFLNDVTAVTDLARGYLIVDWCAAIGGATLRSWARIDSSTVNTFVTDAASWLGDGKPSRSPDSEDTTGTLVFATDAATPPLLKVTWDTHGLTSGDRVAFAGADLPVGLVQGRQYVVSVIDVDNFRVAESPDHANIGWVDAGTGTRTCYEVWWYTAWVGHHRDNPHMWLPGPEFALPNEDQQPHSPWVHWRARGQLLFNHMVLEPPTGENASYGLGPFDAVLDDFVGAIIPISGRDARFGAMCSFSWRMAAALGKRINMVCLGCNGAPLVPSHVQNFFTYPGRVGWFEYDRYGFGLSLDGTESMLSARLKRLVTFIAPNALVAEANTKPLKYLSSCHVQGETDALLDAGRELYGATITDFKRWLRELFDSIKANPYEGGALTPFAQPLLTHDPWETTGVGSSGDFQTFGFDTQRNTNDAMRRAHTADPFAAITITEDLPKQVFQVRKPDPLNPPFGTVDSTTVDNAHFSGQGMVWQGARLAKVILDLVEFALSHSSTALSATNLRLLRIANLALLNVGQGARQITSLAEGTTEANLVTTLMPEAIRQLLSMRTWTWATRLEPATKIQHDHPDWLCAYAVPGRAVTVVEIRPPPPDVSSTNLALSAYPGTIEVAVTAPGADPEPFEIVRDQSGNRILYCNVDEVAGDVTETEVSDGKLHPERLPRRPLIRYVDHALDPNDYSDAFATALSWYLASMLASALVKGPAGALVTAEALLKVGGFIRIEAANETRTQVPVTDSRETHRPSWISGR